jgi:trehalose/maltose hydrolase-like predicted phosphorylase
MDTYDIELESPLKRGGYPALATWISRNPDHDTFIFRRFDRLAARNLLHLESQVAALEYSLDQLDQSAIDRAKTNNDVDIRRSLGNWELFAERAKDSKAPDVERMQVSNLISAKLKEYREDRSIRL